MPQLHKCRAEGNLDREICRIQKLLIQWWKNNDIIDCSDVKSTGKKGQGPIMARQENLEELKTKTALQLDSIRHLDMTRQMFLQQISNIASMSESNVVKACINSIKAIDDIMKTIKSKTADEVQGLSSFNLANLTETNWLRSLESSSNTEFYTVRC